MSYQRDRDHFIGVIVTECTNQPGDDNIHTNEAVSLARLILRNAQTLDRLAVKQCNEPWTEGDEKAVEKVRERIDEACRPWGITPNYSRDPRGAVVKLILPSGRWNSWGGEEEGYCVPTR